MQKLLTLFQQKYSSVFAYNVLENQLLQLCTGCTVFSISVTVRLLTVMPEVCHGLTNEKQRKTDIRLNDQ